MTQLPVPNAAHYWLRNAHVPLCLVTSPSAMLVARSTQEGLVKVDLEIKDGQIQTLQPAQMLPPQALSPEVPSLDLRGGIVFPCFVDLHTHLDKGHTWYRAPNPDGTFASALAAVTKDAEQYWQLEDVYRRFEFGLKCSYAHGTQAIRTHLDLGRNQAEINLEVFASLQRSWADRLTLQAVCLVPSELFATPAGEWMADRMATVPGGVLGCLTLMQPDLAQHLDRIFDLAIDRGLDLDFHTDENLDPGSIALKIIAEVALKKQFPGQITCGHCCSLSVQPPETVHETLNLLHQAGIAIVSLPMCNLYLQDRHSGKTPRNRGVTLIQELQQAEIPVAIASDNCRDPFYGFGDHDMLEVLTMGVRIAHLDYPYNNTPALITSLPAKLMGLPSVGQLGPSQAADLVLFRGRSFSELLSRHQADRVVLRRGRAIDRTLPDYAELDDLVWTTHHSNPVDVEAT